MDLFASTIPFICPTAAFLDTEAYYEANLRQVDGDGSGEDPNRSEKQWAVSAVNPRNRLLAWDWDTGNRQRPTWRIDGIASYGTEFFAVPLVGAGSVRRISVHIPDQARHPPALRQALQTVEAACATASQGAVAAVAAVRRLPIIAQYIVQALTHWSSQIEGFAELYTSLPFGSTRILLERLVPDVRDTRPRFYRLPASPLSPLSGPGPLLRVAELQGMWAYQRALQADPPIRGSLFAVELISDVGGMDLYDRRLLFEAYSLNELAEAMLDSLDLGEKTEDTLPLRSNILTIRGLCTDNMAFSKRQEGLAIRTKCLAIRKQCFATIAAGGEEETDAGDESADDSGDDHPTRDDEVRLFNSYTDLVCSLQQINDFAGVRRLLADCLAQYQAWGPEDGTGLAYEYAKYYNQMAYVLLWEGSGAEAVRFAQRASDLVDRDAPDTGISLLYQADVAHIAFQAAEGDTAAQYRAAAHLESLLARAETMFGLDFLQALEFRLNLGIMYYLIGEGGDLAAAEGHLRTSLDRASKIQSWPRENTIRGEYYLSQVLLLLRGAEEGKADDDEQRTLEARAQDGLAALLATQDDKEAAAMKKRYGGTNDAMLFDYLVHWENRLVTPRQDDGDAPSGNRSSSSRSLTSSSTASDTDTE